MWCWIALLTLASLLVLMFASFSMTLTRISRHEGLPLAYSKEIRKTLMLYEFGTLGFPRRFASLNASSSIDASTLGPSYICGTLGELAESYCEVCADILETDQHIFSRCPRATKIWGMIGVSASDENCRHPWLIATPPKLPYPRCTWMWFFGSSGIFGKPTML